MVPDTQYGSLNNAKPSEKVPHDFVLNVTCSQNYELDFGGSSLPQCYNGTWTRVPRCQPGRYVFFNKT